MSKKEQERNRDFINKEIERKFGSDFLFSVYMDRNQKDKLLKPLLLVVLSDSGYYKARSIMSDFFTRYADKVSGIHLDIQAYKQVNQAAELGEPRVISFFQRVENSRESVYGDTKAFLEIKNLCSESHGFDSTVLQDLLAERITSSKKHLDSMLKSMLGLIHYYSLSSVQYHILQKKIEDKKMVPKSFMGNYGDPILNRDSFSVFFSSNEESEIYGLWKAAEESSTKLNSLDSETNIGYRHVWQTMIQALVQEHEENDEQGI